MELVEVEMPLDSSGEKEISELFESPHRHMILTAWLSILDEMKLNTPAMSTYLSTATITNSVPSPSARAWMAVKSLSRRFSAGICWATWINIRHICCNN